MFVFDRGALYVAEVAVMGTLDVRIGVLGPLQVRIGDGEVALPGMRPSIVLASLALSAGRTVSPEVLIDHVWGDRLPLSAADSLHSLVSRLRGAVGADVIQTATGGGYRLDVDADQVDLLRFRRQIEEAGRAEDPEKTRHVLNEALELWRGDPLGGLASERLHRDVVPGLVEEYLSALERRIELDLAAGLHSTLIAELRDLVARHPLRETLWRLLIIALDESGRRADALDAYHRLRVDLRERLGIDPAGELQILFQRLLADSTPASADAAEAQGEANAPRPRTDTWITSRALPGDIADFTGRDHELDELLAAAGGRDGAGQTVTIAAIDGMAGVGKTTLAIRLAHRLADRFPDGHLFIDLQGHTPGHEAMDPAAALDVLLRAIGVPGERIPGPVAERAALWRSELSGRRVLILLDNAATAAQVRPLIPGAAGVLAVVTSRRRIADLDGATTLSLDVLPAWDALTLFTAIVGEERCAAEPTAVGEVLGLCGHLPLAIRIAAARLRARPAWSVEYLATRLADQQHRLAELSAGERSVAAAFALSYQHLTPAHQGIFRLLGLHPGTSVDARLAAAMATVDPRDAEALLEDLLDAHLLRQPEPGRYRFHDLLRRYAHQTALEADSEAARRTAVARVIDYYTDAVHRTGPYVSPGRAPAPVSLEHPPAAPVHFETQQQALDWLDTERTNLTSTVVHAADQGLDKGSWQLARDLWSFFRLRGHLADWTGTQQTALAAARRLGDSAAEADCLRVLGIASWESARYGEATEYYVQALSRYRAAADLHGECATLTNLGMIHWRLESYAEALDYHRQALAVAHRLPTDPWREASIRIGLGLSLWKTGQLEEALEHTQSAYEAFSAADDARGAGGALSNLSLIHRDLGRFDQALHDMEQALDLMRTSGDRRGEGELLNDLAATHHAMGRFDQAERAHRDALRLAVEVTNRDEEGRAHHGLARTLAASDPQAAVAHWKQALAIYTELAVPRAADVRRELEDFTGKHPDQNRSGSAADA